MHKQLCDLKTNKAKGLDNISPLFLKIAAPVIAQPLCHVLNCSVQSGIFPSQWKLAKVTPLHKKGPTDCMGNFRPISILCTLSKILERHVHNHLYNYLMTENLLHPSQSGFRPNHSCETALAHMTDAWINALDKGNMVGTLFIDLRKAFDSVDHSLLLKKLSIYGCSEPSMEWFKSYLTNRWQCVDIKNVHSEYEPVSCGVPQGSILGPLLFLLFVNDLSLCLSHCTASLYADDSTAYVFGQDLKAIEEKLNVDARNISKWCSENKLDINVQKTKCMLITTPQRRATMASTNLAIYINNEVVPNSNCEKLLGVHVHNSFDWSEQVSYVCKCINFRLRVFKQISKFLTPQARTIYCNSYVLPYLDYCNTVWGNTTQSNILKVFRLQKYASRLTFDNFESRSAELMEKLNWLPLHYRIEYNKLIMMFKALNNTAPMYISDMFKYNTNPVYSLRSASAEKLFLPKPHSEILRKGLSYSGPKLWNSLPKNMKNCNSLCQFKNLLYVHLNNLWHVECVDDFM